MFGPLELRTAHEIGVAIGVGVGDGGLGVDLGDPLVQVHRRRHHLRGHVGGQDAIEGVDAFAGQHAVAQGGAIGLSVGAGVEGDGRRRRGGP